MSGYIGNIPVPQATQTRDVFTATSGQTSFATSGYTPGFLDVWLNGVKLVNGTDFTATNGSDVVLSSGAATSDIVEVLSYSTYEVNNQAFTGDFSVDGTTFKVDSTNNRVAVGTATPDSTFVVNGSGARQKITDGTNTLSMGQFDGLTNQIGSAGRDLYLLTSGTNNIKFGTNNTERMNLDSSGRLTLPYQPAWHYIGGTPLVTASYVTIKPSTAVIANANYNTSTGLFTAPVSGKYIVGVWGLVYPIDNNTFTYLFMKNGGTVGHVVQHGHHLDNNHYSFSATMLVSLAANDTIGFQILRTGGSADAYSSQWNQWGYLIG